MLPYFLQKMASQLLGVVIVFNWLTLPVTLWRTLVGAIVSSKVFWAWCFSLNAYTYMVLLVSTEYLVIKCLAVVVMKRVLPILDDFCALFLFLANLLVVSLLAVMNCYTVGNHQAHMRIQGLPIEMAEHSPLQFE